jgi:spore germination protein GerM
VSRAGARLLAALAAAVLVLAACDVPTNEEPVELSGPFAMLETTTTTSTTSPAVDSKDVIVWMLRTDGGATVLQPVPRVVNVNAGIQELLNNLFTQPPSDERPAEVGLTTAIPSGAVLLAAQPSQIDGDRLVVDVRGLFGEQGLQGVPLRNALAQIVWTATEPGSGFASVVFRSDGQEVDALVDDLETTSDPVTREDYRRRS